MWEVWSFAMIEVLYNPGAGRQAAVMLEKLKDRYAGVPMRMQDVTHMQEYAGLYALCQEDCIIVAGGDGTLTRFANDVDVSALACGVKYYPIGSGNDFAKDCGHVRGCEPFDVKERLSHLPTFTANGVTRKFINGVGAGLDGYVCREGNAQHKRTGKAVNYTLVAIRSLLFGYKPVTAAVTVDGVRRAYEKVWFAAAMHGRYFGGGMMLTPDQHRDNESGTVTSLVYFGKGKLFTLYIFPTIFKGTHVKYKENIILRRGSSVEVTFDRPVDLQVDGEVIENVTGYTVCTAPV